MKRVLDRALSELTGPIPELSAVVLSAAPDGLIAWCWTRDDKPEVALGFAALDRAATVCLEGLGASLRRRNLMLTAEDYYISAWPLYESNELDEHAAEGNQGRLPSRLVITMVFAGDIQRGMVLLHGTRIRLHLREALDQAWERDRDLRTGLVELLSQAEEPVELIHRLVESSGVDLRRLSRLDALNTQERERVRAAIGRLRVAPLLN